VLTALAAALTGLATGCGTAQAPRYANPVLPGEYPDPSVVRAGFGYRAVTTTKAWLPPFAMLYSRDLVNWSVTGSVLTERPRWARPPLWAPELTRHGRRWLVYYSARDRRGRFCIAVAISGRAGGPFRDHGPLTCPRLGAIDPLPVRDERGRPYLIWKLDGNRFRRPTPIVAAPLRGDGLRLAGRSRELFRNDLRWEGRVVEAPALARHGGIFYLLYSARSCCGRRCNYATGAARARSLLGPWRKRPRPILRTGGRFRCPGHGSVVSAPDGTAYFAYHAYPAKASVHVGRSLLLDRLRWGPDGWPRIGAGGVPGPGAPSPLGAVHRPAPQAIGDGFAGRRLAPGWSWTRARPTLRLARGHLRLGRGLLARQPGTGDYTAETVVLGSSRRARPALVAYSARHQQVGVKLRGRRVAAFRRSAGGTRVLASRTLAPRGPVVLRMRARGGARFRLWAVRRGHRVQLGREHRAPRWDGAVRVALSVFGPRRAHAAFGRFELKPAPTASP
jgi:xylan 1,4-beta-xylosidase